MQLNGIGRLFTFFFAAVNHENFNELASWGQFQPELVAHRLGQGLDVGMLSVFLISFLLRRR